MPEIAAARDADSRTWIGPVFACLFILSILKGIRMPNLWAMTHYLFTYEHGFMLRALWGELLRQLFGAWTASYFFLAGIALATFAASLVLLWRACRRLPLTSNTAPFLLVFAASPALAYLAHIVGYLDHVGYLAAIIGFAFRRRWRLQLTWLLASAVALPLVHEASILWVGCVMGLVVITGAAPPRPRLIALLAVGVLWTASTASVFQFGRVSLQRVERLRQERASFARFPVRRDAFHTLDTTLEELRAAMAAVWTEPVRQMEATSSALVFAPAWLLLGVIAIRCAWSLQGSAVVRAAAVSLTFGAATSPLLLHLAATDQHRWNALATFSIGLAALIVMQASPPAGDGSRSGRGLALALIVAIWSIASHGRFFDGVQPKHPPFSRQIYFLKDAIQDPDRAKWIPLY